MLLLLDQDSNLELLPQTKKKSCISSSFFWLISKAYKPQSTAEACLALGQQL
jgi:hypothetical protein